MSLARCLVFCVVLSIATNAVQSQVVVNSEPAMEVDDGAMMLENDLPPAVEVDEPLLPVISPIEMAEPPQAEVTAPGLMPSQESLEDELVSPTPEDELVSPTPEDALVSPTPEDELGSTTPEDTAETDDLAEESEEQSTQDNDDDGADRLSLLPTMLTIVLSLVILL